MVSHLCPAPATLPSQALIPVTLLRITRLHLCLSLAADNLPSAVRLSSVLTPQPFSENVGLMRYIGDLLVDLVSTLWECKSPQLEESDWQVWLVRMSVARRGWFTISSISVTYRDPTNILCLLNFESDKLRFVAVPAQNASDLHSHNVDIKCPNQSPLYLIRPIFGLYVCGVCTGRWKMDGRW